MAKKKAARTKKKKATRKRASIIEVTTGTDSRSQVRPAGSQQSSGSAQRWTFLTNHAHVLVLLNSDEAPVLREVALRVGITERAVQRIIQDLEQGGCIERERVGRRNRYRVLKNQRLRHSIEAHRTIGDLLDLIAPES